MKFNWNGDEWVEGQKSEQVWKRELLIFACILVGGFDLCAWWFLWGSEMLTRHFHMLGF